MGDGRDAGATAPTGDGHPATAFTEARARALLAAAGERADAAELLALGENAVFALDGPRPQVVRVGRGPWLRARAARELRVAAWLAQQGVPAVRAARPGVTVVDGHPLTFWQRLSEPVRPSTPADLAALLRLVHALPAPPFELPRRELLSGVGNWLRLAGDAVPEEDAAYLRDRCRDLEAELGELTPVLPPGPLHGDALPRNVHIGPDGPLLLDLETFSDDMREHDLTVLALGLRRYGLDAAAYSGFVDVYGWDVREWSGCTVLRGARETASCAWVAQHAPGNPAAGREFARRVASLREGDASVRWHAF